MKITMHGVLGDTEVEQIICRPNQIRTREKAWDKRNYVVVEIKQIDRYTTLMRFLYVGKTDRVQS